jgi:hypothetical protein
MYSSEIFYFILFAVVIVSASFLPSSLLLLLDHLLVRVSMVVALLYFIHIGPTAGLFCFMAFAALYMERNRRKAGLAAKKLDEMEVPRHPQATVQQASLPQTTVPVASFDSADHFEVEYSPSSSSFSDEFEPVDSSINQKAVLSTVYRDGSPSASHQLYEELGLGHLDGVETVA